MADESNANVALVEGAEPTPAESLTAPEGSPAVKEGEAKPAEKPPIEGKSSQEAPSPDDSEDAKLPFNKHPRWVKIYGENKEMKGTLSALEELGIKSKDDAELLLKDVDTAKAEGLEEGRAELTNWIVRDPQGFRVDLHKKHPEVFEELVQSDVLSFAEAIAKAGNKELANQIAEAARDYFGEGQKNGRRAPESSERAAIRTEKLSIQEEKQAVFDEQAASEINTVFQSKIAELTKGIAFHSEKQRERFKFNLAQAAKAALGRNPIFSRQYERLGDVRGLSRAELQGRRKEVVALHLKYAIDANLLNRVIEEEREVAGLKLQPKKQDGEIHTEVTGSGAPVNGKLTQDAKDKKYAELSDKYAGRVLEARYAEWLHSQ